MNEYIFTTKHTVLIEADSEEEATEIYENLDDYGDISDVEIKERRWLNFYWRLPYLHG